MTLLRITDEIDAKSPAAQSAAPGRAASLRTTDISTPERRRGLRIRQARPVKLFDGAYATFFAGRTEDISVTGLRIELPVSTPLSAGKIITIHVGLTREGSTLANRKQLMPARIVWVEQDRSSGHAIAGVEFLASIAAHLDAA